MQVRTANQADIERLSHMGCESFPSGYSYEERVRLYRNHTRRKLEEDVLVGEVDGEMVAALSAIPYTIWIGGARLAMLGLATVVNALEARRRGYASALCCAAIARGRARDFVVSILYPFRYDFYRKLGWGTIGELIEYNFHPRNLPHYETQRNVRRFRPQDIDAVATCYQRFVERGNCLAESPPSVWQDWQLRITERKLIVMVYEQQGEIRGYLSFCFESGHDMLTQTLSVEELIYDDRESYQGLLGFLATLRDQVTSIRYWASPSEAFHYILNDPRDVKQPMLASMVSRAGQYGFSYMLRVLNVEQALIMRPNYHHLNGSICFQILDEQIPENSRRFRFTLTEGQPTINLVEDREMAQVHLGIDIFSQLYAGAITASRAHFLGLLEIKDTASVPLTLSWLDQAFSLPKPFLLDQF
ncbi:MAG: GNAT family N-acetyltransferase [Acidobacteriota bacterium]